MAETLHLQPDPEPATEQVRLGDQTLELDPESAAAVRGAFETLAQQYGSALEEYRRQALQSIGQERISLERSQQPRIHPDRAVDVFTA